MLSVERLRQLIDYNQSTGAFIWKKRVGTEAHIARWNTKYAGRVAGRQKPGKNGYLTISVDSQPYLSHRLAWFYMTGEWPERLIDHIDGDRSNNRWANLRPATNSQNRANCFVKTRNKTGFKGASFHRYSGLYAAKIVINGKQISLGYHKTAESAAEAYRIAAEKHFGEFARVAC